MTAQPKIKPQSIFDLDDPASHYAQQVASGNILAGPHVRDACARHLADLKKGHFRGLYWDPAAANHAIGFFCDVLCLNGGEFEGVPFVPELWQAFIIGSLYGWHNADGSRRFQVAYIETGKGSGKSPLAAGIGIMGLVADGEYRAEIYAAATKKDQAMILFRDAVAMVNLSPDLAARIESSGAAGREWNLAYHATGSFFRPISADDGQSGPRPYIALLDEIHEHKNARVVEMMRAGTKGRRNPLVLMITNSGTDRKSVCYDYHRYGAEVSAQAKTDDTFFAYICALDEEDDPFTDESCWPKANPSLGITIQPKYLRDQVTQAKGMPGKENIVKRLNFCMWVEGHNPAISYHIWQDAGDDYSEDDLRGRRCVAGLDLGSTIDLTSLVLAFEPTEADPYWRILPYFWLPDTGLADKSEKDRVPYSTWHHQGHLETTPGKAVSRLFVLQRLATLTARFDIRALAYDRWRIEDLKQLAADEGLQLPEMVPHGQGYKDMAPAVEEFERLLLNDQFRHNRNPVMTMCAANAVWDEDPAGNRKPAKDKATGRIDGIVACLMAVNKGVNAPEPEASVYNTRGIRTL